MEKLKQILALRLFDIGAVQFGEFQLKLHEKNPRAPLSPIFFNLRSALNPKPGQLQSADYEVIGHLMNDLIERDGISFMAVAAVPNAGDPIAEALAMLNPQLPRMIRLTKTTTEDKRSVTGVVDGDGVTGTTVLLVDDLITKADSKLEASAVLRQAGANVNDVMVLVDREQGGAKELAEVGCKLHAVFTLSELLDIYVNAGKIEASKRDEVLAYVAAN